MSDRIEGKYKLFASFRPLGEDGRDTGEFVDDNAATCLIFESRPPMVFCCETDRRFDERGVDLLDPGSAGGRPLVRVGGLYDVVGSQLAGWQPNSEVYAAARALSGPWSEFRNLAPPEINNFGSPSTMLFKVTGSKTTAVIFMGDLWRRGEPWDSRSLWMPLEIGNGAMKLRAARADAISRS